MGKRANGEGTISKRVKDGKVVGWRTAITVGYDEKGQQIRRWISGKTQSEVAEALRKLKNDLADGRLIGRGDLTVGAYLDQWLEHVENKGLKPNTARSYRDAVRLYLKPHLGKLPLENLRPTDVEGLISKLRRSGKSPALMGYALRVLKMALKQAVIWQLVPNNVAWGIKAPKKEDRDLHCWTEQQAARFLRLAKDHRLYAAFYLALATGMRRGEILGLRWRDIDWERQRLTIRNHLVENRLPGTEGKLHRGQPTVSAIQVTLQTPKTRKSRRVVILSPGTVARLREHQQRQQQEREVLGPDWQDQDFVSANEFGEPTAPRTLYGWYQELVAEAGLPYLRFHDLRHTAASLMIQRGLSPKVVSDRLGHTDIAFTMRVYAHLYDEQREEAAFDLEEDATGPGDEET